MDRYKDIDGNGLENSETINNIGKEHGMEREEHTEIEQPNPAIATPGIPQEMPAREIR